MASPCQVESAPAVLTALANALLKEPDDLDGRIEFIRLFLSPNGAVCPPWQSVQAPPPGESPQLMGSTHHRALHWFRQFGFEPQTGSEPADHAGLLLLFYARLIGSGASDEDLARFEHEHLAWIPAFAFRLETQARTEYFRSAARLLREALSQVLPDSAPSA